MTKLISLISGGIDSPVASALMQKRGCEIVYVHFYNFTPNSISVKHKVLDLVKKVSPKSKLYLVPFKELQMEIIRKVASKYRMIVYRRFMLRIAEEIAKKENATGLLTGDNLAQVASQTLDNLYVINEPAKLPVIRPLIGFDKEETIQIAKQIGTYETSILPYDDCCQFLIAKHPETRADLETIKKLEESFDVEKLVSAAVKSTEQISA